MTPFEGVATAGAALLAGSTRAPESASPGCGPGPAAAGQLQSLLATGTSCEPLAPVSLAKPPTALVSSSSSESLAPHTPAVEDVAEGITEDADGWELASESRFAYVTLLTRDSYLMGAQALARSLRATQSRHPLLVMYTADTLAQSAVEQLQEEENCQPLAVDRYTPEGEHDFGQYKMQLYAECWTKLRMWELEEFDRLVYLDADMIVLRNMDHLFSLPPGFYAGFFVMSPSRTQLAQFSAWLAAGEVTIGGYAEQDFLNEVYKDTWRVLPHTFNAQKGIRHHHPELWRRHWHDVAVIHYTDAKPWQKDHPEHEHHADIVALWWEAFEGRAPAASLPAKFA